MLIAKYTHSLCTQHNQIFSIGGHDAQSYIADCEVYDAISNHWKSLPNLATPRGYCAAIIFERTWIYAIGG